MRTQRTRLHSALLNASIQCFERPSHVRRSIVVVGKHQLRPQACGQSLEEHISQPQHDLAQICLVILAIRTRYMAKCPQQWTRTVAHKRMFSRVLVQLVGTSLSQQISQLQIPMPPLQTHWMLPMSLQMSLRPLLIRGHPCQWRPPQPSTHSGPLMHGGDKNQHPTC